VTWGPFLFAVVYQIVTWIAASLTYPQLLLDPLLSITLGVVIGVGYEYLQQLPPVVAEGAEAPVALAGAPQHSSTWPLATLAPT
ncbi:PPE family protein, partial [Mycobacterium kansasii]